MFKIRKAFTLTELMITVILLGVIAGFGIPSYNKSREKALEKEAVHNLRMIVEALKLYYVRNDNTYTDMLDVNAINATLNLGIIEGGSADYMRYQCIAAGGPPPGALCGAIRMIPGGGSTWVIVTQLTQNRLIMFSCMTGDCPSYAGAYPETF